MRKIGHMGTLEMRSPILSIKKLPRKDFMAIPFQSALVPLL